MSNYRINEQDESCCPHTSDAQYISYALSLFITQSCLVGVENPICFGWMGLKEEIAEIVNTGFELLFDTKNPLQIDSFIKNFLSIITPQDGINFPWFILYSICLLMDSPDLNLIWAGYCTQVVDSVMNGHNDNFAYGYNSYISELVGIIPDDELSELLI